MNLNVRVKYIHSEINSLDRVEILRDLRLGKIDVIVGVNLLREGLDLPEVSLVAILDADKEGFLRSEKSLLQTAGRTARNVNGMVIFYADKVTESMSKVISETARRRKIQQEYNEANNIQPETVYKSYEDIISTTIVADSISKNETYKRKSKSDESVNTALKAMIKPVMDETSNEQRKELIEQLRKEMIEAAKDLEFERAAELRDELQRLSN